jgi:hypothetical protein
LILGIVFGIIKGYSIAMKKLFLIFLLVLMLLPAAPASAQENSLNKEAFRFDLRSITHEDVKEEKFVRQGVNFLFTRAVTIMAATIGSASVLMITVGGFMILASAGRQQWVDNGKSFIFKALIGLAVALGAYILVATVQILIKSIYG